MEALGRPFSGLRAIPIPLIDARGTSRGTSHRSGLDGRVDQGHPPAAGVCDRGSGMGISSEVSTNLLTDIVRNALKVVPTLMGGPTSVTVGVPE